MEFDYEDFLDSKGKSDVNWFTKTPYSETYYEKAKEWATLPMYQAPIVKQVVEAIRDHPITILTAGTGVGKSVTVPKYMLRLFYILGNGTFDDKVAMTTPKRSTTKFAADYAAECLDAPIGTKVDYAYRGHTASHKAQLLFCTDGLLLARAMGSDPLLKEFRGIIIDEAHERPVPTDILLWFLRRVLRQRPEFRVVVMSATMDTRPYVDYFSDLSPKVIDVAGRPNHPIKSHFLKDTPSKKDVVKAAWECVGFLVGSTSEGDVLAFVPKIKDTKDACRNLMDEKRRGKDRKGTFADVACLTVYASVDDDTMVLVKDLSKFRETGKRRRVIFATNVAESSLTIKGITYVIDTGLELNVKWDARAHANAITVDWITQGQVKQRIGRTGRTAPGVAYHMYTEAHMAAMTPLPPPKLLTVDISDYVVRMVQRSRLADAVRTFSELLTPPGVSQVVDAVAYLHFYGLLSVRLAADADAKPLAYDKVPYHKMKSFHDLLAYDGEVTLIGRAMAQVDGLAPVYALLLVWGEVFDCQRDMVVLASILEVTGGNVDILWEDPDGPDKIMSKAIHDPWSDHRSLVHAYDALYGKRKMQGLVKGMWEAIDAKVGRYYRMSMPEDTLASLRDRAAVPGLSPFENALLAARCFHVTFDDGGKGTNVFPLERCMGNVQRKLGPSARHVAVYEELMKIGDNNTKFNVVTYFPSISPEELRAHVANKAL